MFSVQVLWQQILLLKREPFLEILVFRGIKQDQAAKDFSHSENVGNNRDTS